MGCDLQKHVCWQVTRMHLYLHSKLELGFSMIHRTFRFCKYTILRYRFEESGAKWINFPVHMGEECLTPNFDQPQISNSPRHTVCQFHRYICGVAWHGIQVAISQMFSVPQAWSTKPSTMRRASGPELKMSDAGEGNLLELTYSQETWRPSCCRGSLSNIDCRVPNAWPQETEWYEWCSSYISKNSWSVTFSRFHLNDVCWTCFLIPVYFEPPTNWKRVRSPMAVDMSILLWYST